MGIAMMGVMHLYLGYTQPLLVQSIMPIKSTLESKVIKIHVLGSEAVGDLKRPWKTGGLFGGAGGEVTSLLELALTRRDPRQIRKLSRKLRSVLERQRRSKLLNYIA
jgi:Phosphate transport (Pho88)